MRKIEEEMQEIGFVIGLCTEQLYNGDLLAVFHEKLKTYFLSKF